MTDGPIIEVTGVQRVGDQFEIHGSPVIANSQLCAAYDEGEGRCAPVAIQDPGDRRQRWAAQVPLEATQVVVYECSSAELDDRNFVTFSLEYQ